MRDTLSKWAPGFNSQTFIGIIATLQLIFEEFEDGKSGEMGAKNMLSFAICIWATEPAGRASSRFLPRESRLRQENKVIKLEICS